MSLFGAVTVPTQSEHEEHGTRILALEKQSAELRNTVAQRTEAIEQELAAIKQAQADLARKENADAQRIQLEIEPIVATNPTLSNQKLDELSRKVTQLEEKETTDSVNINALRHQQGQQPAGRLLNHVENE